MGKIDISIENIIKKYQLYSYRRTINLRKRYTRHKFNFFKISGVDIELTHYCCLNPINIVDIETKVSTFFKSKKLKLNFANDEYRELAVIPDNILDDVINYYNYLEKNKDMENRTINAVILLPSPIKLDKCDLFFDKITVVGNKSSGECFFCANDISNFFKLDDMKDILFNNNMKYIENTHYIYFYSLIKNKTQIFLTYNGLLKLLFSFENNIDGSFIDYCINILFTTHIGTKKQKRKLAGDVLGITPNVIKNVFDASATTFPCIYLIELGTVKELKRSIKINKKYDNDNKVYKWGFTSDLKSKMQVNTKKS